MQELYEIINNLTNYSSLVETTENTRILSIENLVVGGGMALTWGAIIYLRKKTIEYIRGRREQLDLFEDYK